MRDKKELLAQIMRHLAANEMEQANTQIAVFMDEVPEITAEEITEIAQKLDDDGIFANTGQHLNIERSVFELVDKKITAHDLSAFPQGHPIHTFLTENKQIKELVNRANQLLKSDNSYTTLFSDWLLVGRQFQEIEKHYLRKENQLFPYLEKRGFSHPSTVMWSMHDEIRRLIKAFRATLEPQNKVNAKKALEVLAREADEMITKEEKVLLPKSAKLLTEGDWREIRQGEDEIGWMVPEPPQSWQEGATMEKHLKSDPERIKSILYIIRSFMDGQPIETLKAEFKTKLRDSITPAEFALAEQKVKDYGVSDQQLHERIDALLNVFKAGFDKVRVNTFAEGHPIDTFIKENKAIKGLIKELREKESAVDTEAVDLEFWEEAYRKISQINAHYLRKENQLFPYLEQKGFNKPSTVMWALHDDVRGLIKYYRSLLDDKKYQELFSSQEMLFSALEDMIYKEEKILWPTSLELLSEREWAEIRQGEDEIGYCLIDEPPLWSPERKPEPADESNKSKKAEPVPYTGAGTPGSRVGSINLEIGSVTPEQINLIFKHLPFDVTYVDEFDEVRYYNKGDERVFPRSPGIIGRQVKFCHPPKSVHIVEKIVDAFKCGKKNNADFWIKLQGKFIFIQYFAVRDHSGNYKGVIEITYDATTVRSLEGEQRLLDWDRKP